MCDTTFTICDSLQRDALLSRLGAGEPAGPVGFNDALSLVHKVALLRVATVGEKTLIVECDNTYAALDGARQLSELGEVVSYYETFHSGAPVDIWSGGEMRLSITDIYLNPTYQHGPDTDKYNSLLDEIGLTEDELDDDADVAAMAREFVRQITGIDLSSDVLAAHEYTLYHAPATD